MRDDKTRRKSSVMKDDDEREYAHSGARQPSRTTDGDDQRRQRRRRKASSSSSDNGDVPAEDNDLNEVGEVRAEDSGRRERRKKSATSSETALPKSNNTHAGATARPISGRAAARHAEERISTRQLKSTNTCGDASARPASGRAVDRYTEESATQRAEDRVSSTRRSHVDGDFSLQEFDHEEVVTTTTSMEDIPSSLQLIPKRDIQSPTISTQQEVPMEKQRLGSSARGRNALETTVVMEQPRQMTADDLDELRRLAADLNRCLEWQNRSPVQGSGPGSGTYPARHVGPDGPSTGATFKQGSQRSDNWLYGHQGNAYDVHPYGASFYGHSGNASGMYPGCLWNTPRPEAYVPGRSGNACGAYPNSVQYVSPNATIVEVDRVLQEQQQVEENQPEVERRQVISRSPAQFFEGAIPGSAVTRSSSGIQQGQRVSPLGEQERQVTGRSAVQFCESVIPGRTVNPPNGGMRQNTTAMDTSIEQAFEDRRSTNGRPVVQFCESATTGNTVIRPDTESRQNTTVKTLAEQTPVKEATEQEPAGTVYHTARMKRDDSSDRGEPATEPELRTKEKKVLQYNSEDSEDDDGTDVRRHRKEKTRTDAKAGATRHSSRQLNGASKRASDPADAKVGSTQHSPPKKSNSTSQNRTADRTSRQQKRSSTSTPKSASDEDRKCDQRKRSSPRGTKRGEDDSEDTSRKFFRGRNCRCT